MDTLLPADPDRGLTPAKLDDAEQSFDGHGYPFGMHTAAGAARLDLVVDGFAHVVRAGLGRDVAVAYLRGELVRMERDGHAEYSDTVVREALVGALEPHCLDAGVVPVTDAEVNEVALLISLACLTAAVSQVRSAMPRT